jgi:biopolymer transport protein ExbD
MFAKKKGRRGAEIPSSSLADIAFLLLVFFLVVTTIDVDTGIGLVLPPPPDDTEPPPPIRERNLLKILVNSQGLVLINERPTAIADVRERVIEFVDNANRANDENLSVSPQAAIVSIKTDRQTPYEIYINMLDEVRGAYRELRDAASMAQFGINYERYRNSVTSSADDAIRQMYPMNVSIAEPDPGTQ